MTPVGGPHGGERPDGEPTGEERPAAPVPLLDVRLLELLVCPLTKGPLTYDAERGELVSRVAGLAYPVRDGIPVMLPSEARQVEAP
jgi:uncharacterized protein YbaR (Trm112 family)